jgi:hypothetical protein
MKWVGHGGNAFKILVRKPEEDKYRWKDNIKMDLKQIGCRLVPFSSTQGPVF